jgi:hypothetical protein
MGHANFRFMQSASLSLPPPPSLSLWFSKISSIVLLFNGNAWCIEYNMSLTNWSFGLDDVMQALYLF